MRLCKDYCWFWGRWSYIITIFMIWISILSCKSTTPVIVPEYHKEVTHHVDTIHQTDSFISNSFTTIREVDSATLAALGYQIRGLETAYLVEINNMQRQISQLSQSHRDTVHITDTIPKIVEVPVKISKWQQLKMDFVELLILAFLLSVVLLLIKSRKKSG